MRILYQMASRKCLAVSPGRIRCCLLCLNAQLFLYLVFLVAGTDARRAASTKLLDDSAGVIIPPHHHHIAQRLVDFNHVTSDRACRQSADCLFPAFSNCLRYNPFPLPLQAHTLHARDRTIDDRRHQDSRTDHGKDHSSHDDHASVSADGDNRRQLQVVGHVKAFEAQMQYYVPLPVRNHPERTSLFIEPLGFAYNSSNRPIVLLQYHEHDTHWGTLAHCRGDTCPALTSCGPAFPNFRACWNPDLVDPDRVLLDPPVNCPKRNATAGLDPRTRKHISDGYDETCSHREDFIPRDAMALQMFEVKGAYVTDKGYVFNRTHRFVWPGCGRFNELNRHVNVGFSEMAAVLSGAPLDFQHVHVEQLLRNFLAETVPLLLAASSHSSLPFPTPTADILFSRAAGACTTSGLHVEQLVRIQLLPLCRQNHASAPRCCAAAAAHHALHPHPRQPHAGGFNELTVENLSAHLYTPVHACTRLHTPVYVCATTLLPRIMLSTPILASRIQVGSIFEVASPCHHQPNVYFEA
ncbi:unnamed protein product [Closterium sp. NIES-53]